MSVARVYSYLRFSDPKQSAGSSTDRQLAYAAHWAQEHGLALDSSLSLRDEGLSAYHQQHIKTGALGVFLRAVEDGRVPVGSVLVVEGLDRLSRAEPIQAQAQLAQIVNAGITVVTASDGKTYSRAHLKANPMDLVYSLLVMIRAHEESDTKSKRVKASIRHLCEGWKAGTYRGKIRQGHTPHWLTETDSGFELHPEYAEVMKDVLAKYQRGLSGKAIVDHLVSINYPFVKVASYVYKLVRFPQLYGALAVEVDGETHLLEDYYPALISKPEWDELQRVANETGRRRVKGSLPHVITGLGITVCGYCGRPMAGQNLATTKKRLPDGRIRDSYRRLLCASAAAYGGGCPVPGSTSVAPVERAIMSYCSDIVNLQSLYGADRSTTPRAAIAAARQRVEQLTLQLDKLTEVMLSTDDAPQTFVRKARELETQLTKAQQEQKAAERELASVARKDLTGADEAWQKLAEGVEAHDTEARLHARQLVADTFERIVVYHHGVRPNPDAGPRDYSIDLVLVAKGGTARHLKIERDGEWSVGEDFSAPH